jgi:glycosyltransferase involved in cell wall biosynthesis
MKKSLIVISPFTTRSGYGVHSRAIIKSIIDNPDIMAEYDVQLVSLKWGATPQTALDRNNPDDMKLLSLLMPNNQMTYQPDVSIHITIPNEFQRIGKYSIGITAGTEATDAPIEFLKGCNNVDLVLTPSTFTKDVLINTKYDKKNQQTQQVEDTVEVKVPVEVLFEGIDVSMFNKTYVPGELSKYINETVSEDFCFLQVGHWLSGVIGEDRKDVGMVVKTFYDTFKNKKNRPGLIMKTGMAGFSITERDIVLDKIQQIQEIIRESGFGGKFPNIYVINGDLSDNQMAELYNHHKVKAMVSFHKGEGYGLPLLEFAATGKPIIASNYSGPLDFLSPEYNFLLPGQLTKIHGSAANEWLPKDSKWFTINYQYASMMLSQCYEKYDSFLERSRKQSKIIRDNFSIEKMGIKLYEIMNKYISSVPKQITLNLPKLKKI